MMMERRASAELRAAGDKSPRLVGYAAVFDKESQDLGGFIEIIRPGAFARTLKGNVKDPLALVQHMPQLVLGRRSAGTLRLSEDLQGLAFEVDLPDTTAARDLLVSVKRGDVRGASFAFTAAAGGDKWSVRGDTVVRELIDVDLYEITVTAMPAYADTTVATRSFEQNHLFRNAPRLRALRRFLETT